MRVTILKFLSALVFLILFSCSTSSTDGEVIVNDREINFNLGWQFQLQKDTLASGSYIESNWAPVKIPHDWSVAMEYDSTLDGATAYLPGGIGWYRKEFTSHQQESDKTYIVFDGIYNRVTVWLNDEELGFHPYGYSPFYYDITDKLKSGKNEFRLRVDRSRYIDSRWYPGAGIYRNVKLVTTNRLHIPIWGSFISTPTVSSQNAEVLIDLDVINDLDEDKSFDILTEIVSPNGEIVATGKSESLSLKAGSSTKLQQTISIANPSLWSVDDPALYKAVSKIMLNGESVSNKITDFGIRSIRFDPNDGFFLNGEIMKIKGVCLHHDAGLVGSAVPKGVWKRRLLALKEGGCNAVRIAHNPASDEFLQLCDKLGIMVQDEFYDEWDYPKDKRLNQEERHDDYISRGHAEFFQEWAEQDLKTTMMAHRNHPSIIQWSIGNEIEWTYHPRYRNITGYFNMNWRGNYFWSLPPISREQIIENIKNIPPAKYELAKTAQKLSDWTKEMDMTRPVVANCILPSASHETGYGAALDVVGYSYRRVLYDYGHKNYPDKVIMGTENLGQWHEWKSVLERPFISGVFLWTGIDYLGESHGRWPRKALPSGLLDIAGFKKPSFFMMKSLWSDEPSVYIATQTLDKSTFKIDPKSEVPIERKPGGWENALWIWQDVNNHWNYEEEQIVIVEVYSNCEEVELFLNDKSLGKRALADFEDHIYKWGVPFTSGTLEAVGSKNGKTETYTLNSAGEPESIQVVVEESDFFSNGTDVAHVVIQLLDANGYPVKDENREVSFEIEGDVELLGTDNGAPDNVQSHKSKKLMTNQGRALAILRTTDQSGKVVVTVRSEGLKEGKAQLTIN